MPKYDLFQVGPRSRNLCQRFQAELLQNRPSQEKRPAGRIAAVDAPSLERRNPRSRPRYNRAVRRIKSPGRFRCLSAILAAWVQDVLRPRQMGQHCNPTLTDVLRRKTDMRRLQVCACTDVFGGISPLDQASAPAAKPRRPHNAGPSSKTRCSESGQHSLGRRPQKRHF